jgi:hypothetical protein
MYRLLFADFGVEARTHRFQVILLGACMFSIRIPARAGNDVSSVLIVAADGGAFFDNYTLGKWLFNSREVAPPA